MTASAPSRSLRSSTARRWRALRPRSRAAFTLMAIAALIGGGSLILSFWDPWPARATLKTPIDTWPLAFSPDGRTFLTAGEGGITRWDVATGRKEGSPWAIGADQSAFLGEFSPDGRTFAATCTSTGGSMTIRLFDASTGRARWSQTVPFRSSWGLRFADEGRAFRAFLGDVTKPKEGMTAVTWDVESGQERSNRPLSAPIVNTIATVSADGRTLVICPMNKLPVEIWDLEADRSLGSVINPTSTSVVCWGGVGLTHDGRTLAVSREDGTLELWDVATRVLKSTHSIGRRATGIRISPDGRTLAADAHFLVGTLSVAQLAQSIRQLIGLGGREYGEVIVIDLMAGRRLARAADAIHPSFSPDGRTIATRQLDLSLKLRDAPRPR